MALQPPCPELSRAVHINMKGWTHQSNPTRPHCLAERLSLSGDSTSAATLSATHRSGPKTDAETWPTGPKDQCKPVGAIAVEADFEAELARICQRAASKNCLESHDCLGADRWRMPRERAVCKNKALSTNMLKKHTVSHALQVGLQRDKIYKMGQSERVAKPWSFVTSIASGASSTTPSPGR